MKIHNLIILDASGSMDSIYSEALDGVNNTLNTIRIAQLAHTDLEQRATLVSFNSGRRYLKFVFKDQAINNVRNINPSDYQTNNCTALYDAIGDSLLWLEKQIHGDDKALVTIITDGYENASERFTAESVSQLISKMSKKNAVFTYIGANQDVTIEAQKMGIHNALSWNSDSEGTRAMFTKENRERERWYERVKQGDENYQKNFFEETPVQGKKPMHEKETPRVLTSLKPNEVFVFGSNSKGIHLGGGARYAVRHFGAKMGQASGMQGQSYAIPTVGVSFETMALEIENFIIFAKAHPELHFYVTAIGCGHAGYNVYQVAHLFARALYLDNVSLPSAFLQNY